MDNDTYKLNFSSSNSILSTVVPPKSFNSYKSALLSSKVILKADTGATGHYIRKRMKLFKKKLQSTATGPIVRLPNGHLMKHDKKGYLPIPNLPTEATESHTFKDLHSASLLSI